MFSFFSQAAISAFAENSASFFGLVAPNPVAAGRGAPRGTAQFASGFKSK